MKIDLDVTSIVQSTKTRIGLSITFIGAGILLILSNLGIDIKFDNMSINNVIPHDYVIYVQLYIIIALFSLAFTILKQELFLKPKMISDDNISTPCHNCNTFMAVSERTCSECGSIFTYKNNNKKK